MKLIPDEIRYNRNYFMGPNSFHEPKTPNMEIEQFTLSSVAFDRVDLDRAVGMQTSWTMNPDGTLTGLTGDDRLAELREKGISKVVDWNDLDYRLRTITTFGNGDYDHDPVKVLDYFASKYAALELQLSKDYSGDALKKELDQLQAVMDKRISEYAENFSKSVGTFYEENGMSGEIAKLRDSVKNVIYSKKQNYEEFLRQNTDFGDLSGTQDAWLERESDYMACQLRNAYAEDAKGKLSDSENATDGYSMEELIGAAEFARVSNNILQDHTGVSANEEEIGLHLGVMTLKADSYLKQSRVSLARKEALLKALDQKMQKMINRHDNFNQYIIKRFGVNQSVRYPPFDRDAIFQIVDGMQSAYRTSRSLSQALTEGITAAYNNNKEKSDPSNIVERYKSSEFFKYMYEAPVSGSPDYYPSNRDAIFQNTQRFLDYSGQVHISLSNSLHEWRA